MSRLRKAALTGASLYALAILISGGAFAQGIGSQVHVPTIHVPDVHAPQITVPQVHTPDASQRLRQIEDNSKIQRNSDNGRSKTGHKVSKTISKTNLSTPGQKGTRSLSATGENSKTVTTTIVNQPGPIGGPGIPCGDLTCAPFPPVDSADIDKATNIALGNGEVAPPPGIGGPPTGGSVGTQTSGSSGTPNPESAGGTAPKKLVSSVAQPGSILDLNPPSPKDCLGAECKTQDIAGRPGPVAVRVGGPRTVTGERGPSEGPSFGNPGGGLGSNPGNVGPTGGPGWYLPGIGPENDPSGSSGTPNAGNGGFGLPGPGPDADNHGAPNFGGKGGPDFSGKDGIDPGVTFAQPHGVLVGPGQLVTVDPMKDPLSLGDPDSVVPMDNMPDPAKVSDGAIINIVLNTPTGFGGYTPTRGPGVLFVGPITSSADHRAGSEVGHNSDTVGGPPAGGTATGGPQPAPQPTGDDQVSVPVVKRPGGSGSPQPAPQPTGDDQASVPVVVRPGGSSGTPSPPKSGGSGTTPDSESGYGSAHGPVGPHSPGTGMMMGDAGGNGGTPDPNGSAPTGPIGPHSPGTGMTADPESGTGEGTTVHLVKGPIPGGGDPNPMKGDDYTFVAGKFGWGMNGGSALVVRSGATSVRASANIAR